MGETIRKVDQDQRTPSRGQRTLWRRSRDPRPSLLCPPFYRHFFGALTCRGWNRQLLGLRDIRITGFFHDSSSYHVTCDVILNHVVWCRLLHVARGLVYAGVCLHCTSVPRLEMVVSSFSNVLRL